jgi:hypothetical protein
MGRGSFKSSEHSERLKKSADILDFEIPYSVAEIDAAKRLVLEKNGQTDAYLRPVAWRGSEMMGRRRPAQQDPPRHRGPGVAELFRPGPEDEGHPHRHGGVPPSRSGHRALPFQGRRPLL